MKIVGKMIVCVAPHFILNLIFQGSLLIHFQVGMTRLLLDGQVPLMNGHVPIVILLFGMVCVYAYLYKNEKSWDSEDEIRHAILVAACAIFTFFMSYPGTAYSICTMTPWFILVVVVCGGEIKSGLLLETVGMLALAGAHFIENSNIGYCTPRTNNANDVYMALIEKMDLLLDGKLAYIVGAAEGVGIVCLITLLILGFRNYKKEAVGVDHLEIYSIYRMLANCCLAIVPLLFDIVFG